MRACSRWALPFLPCASCWGGRSKLIGVSPFACGAPAGKELPFILDMTPSIVARGKIYKALRRGETIPRIGH